MIRAKKLQLAESFRREDVMSSGLVSTAKWAEVMQRVVGVKIQWQVGVNLKFSNNNVVQLLVPMMVPRECIREDGSILYNNFLEDLEYQTVPDNVSVDGVGLQDENEVLLFEVTQSLFSL